MRSKPTPDSDAAIRTVTGRTLREALDNVRREFGDEACIVESRSLGTGGVEVRVCPPEAIVMTAAPEPNPVETPKVEAAPVPIVDPERERKTAAIEAEIDRIESLVETLSHLRSNETAPQTPGFEDYPLGKRLLGAGASLPAVRHLRRLYQAESGRGGGVSAEAHLRGLIRTSESAWTTLSGCHVFLGDGGAGKTDLILGTAARLRSLGRRPLVLTFAPRHDGEVKRLQAEAAGHGYDAAILRDPGHLAGGLGHFAQYDAVLVDTPAMTGPAIASPDLHGLLAAQEDLHRHMVLPLDIGTDERERLWSVAREWNCDWTALTRLDRTPCPGKLVDVMLAAPMPFSLVAGGAWPGARPEIAAPRTLMARILNGNEAALAASER